MQSTPTLPGWTTQPSVLMVSPSGTVLGLRLGVRVVPGSGLASLCVGSFAPARHVNSAVASTCLRSCECVWCTRRGQTAAYGGDVGSSVWRPLPRVRLHVKRARAGEHAVLPFRAGRPFDIQGAWSGVPRVRLVSSEVPLCLSCSRCGNMLLPLPLPSTVPQVTLLLSLCLCFPQGYALVWFYLPLLRSGWMSGRPVPPCLQARHAVFRAEESRAGLPPRRTEAEAVR